MWANLIVKTDIERIVTYFHTAVCSFGSKTVLVLSDLRSLFVRQQFAKTGIQVNAACFSK